MMPPSQPESVPLSPAGPSTSVSSDSATDVEQRQTMPRTDARTRTALHDPSTPSEWPPPIMELDDYHKASSGATYDYESDSDEYGTYSSAGGQSRRRLGAHGYLPVHRRRRAGGNTPTSGSLLSCVRLPSSRKSRRRPCVFLIGGLLLLAVLAWWAVRTYEFQFELSVYSREWVKAEFDDIKPLKGCFSSPSTEYNMTRHRAGRRHLTSAGFALRSGLSCYDFASTIQRQDDESFEDLLIHTYWRADLKPFSPRQAATIESFLATQPRNSSKLILWSNGAEKLRRNEYVKQFLDNFPTRFEVQQADLSELSEGTEIEGLLDSPGLFDSKGWVDGDALRLLLLWHYGGIWMDMDMLLTRELDLLAENEFVMQWDCYEKPYFQMNGALMHFMKHSPYLCEMFHIMKTSPLPRPNTFDWGSHLYSKAHRRLIAAGVEPFVVIPWCFTDPRNCRRDIRFPDPFLPDPKSWVGINWDKSDSTSGLSGRETFERKLSNVWAIHLHNQWDKAFPAGGYIERMLSNFRDSLY